MSLTLLAPRALLALLFVLPLVALYILKVRRERLVVPSTSLWLAARRDHTARSPFRRLVRETSLLLQLAAIVLTSLALSRPALRATSTAPVLVLVVDTSASMAASDGASTRIELARAAAMRAIDGRAGGEVLVIEAGAEPTRIAGPTSDSATLRRVVDALQARASRGSLGRAVDLAAEEIAARGGAGRVRVITDGAEPWTRRPGLPVDVDRVGHAADNVAVTHIDVRRQAAREADQDVVVVDAIVQSFASSPRDVVAELRVGERAAGEQAFTLAAGAGHALTLPFTPVAGDPSRVVTLRLKYPRGGADALASDDVAYARVPSAATVPVLHASASPDATWVRRALTSDRALAVTSVAPAELARPGAARDALVVEEGACVDVPGARAIVVLAPPPGAPCLGVTVAAAAATPPITSWETEHPLLRFLTFDGVHVRESTALSGAPALLRAGPTSLVADVSRPGRPGVVIGFAAEESDWPLRASFVLFFHNAAEAVRGEVASELASARTGEPLRVRVPPETSEVTLVGPRGVRRTAVTAGGVATFGDVREPGAYRAEWAAPRAGHADLAVNLASAAESNLRAVGETTEAPASGSAVTATPRAREAWPYLALLALAALAADALWLTRTRRRVSRRIA